MVGSVIVTFKIMPEGVDTDLSSLEKTIKKEINPQRMERVPIAFGLNAIQIIKVVDEIEGETDRLTDKIKNLKGVKEVEITNFTRSL